MKWDSARNISKILRLIIFPLYHTFDIKTGRSLQETISKLSTVIDTQFIPHEETKINYEGYLNENGFKIGCKTLSYASSGVVIYGKFEENQAKEISIKVKMRLSYL